MQPKRRALESLSNEALCKLRDEIAALLESRAEQVRKELERLTGGNVTARTTCGTRNGARAKRKKPLPKYRGPDGRTWCGRGGTPRWLTKAIQAGHKLEDFLIVPSDEAVSESKQAAIPESAQDITNTMAAASPGG
jgi:DNA-binding protein H-NS